MTVRPVLALIVAILFSGAAHAEKWVSLGDGFFMDTDSQLRQSDIGSVTIRHINETQRMVFDCGNVKWLPPGQQPQPVGSFAPIFDVACKRRVQTCD